MANVQPIVRIELDPTQPVAEICAVIMAVIPYHPGKDELILLGVQEAIEQRLKQLAAKGDDEKDAKQIREHSGSGEDQPNIPSNQ